MDLSNKQTKAKDYHVIRGRKEVKKNDFELEDERNEKNENFQLKLEELLCLCIFNDVINEI